MTLLDVDRVTGGSARVQADTPPDPQAPRRGATILVTGAAALRALAAAGAGVLLSIGVALLVWAVSPAAGTGARSALAAGVDVYAAAHAMTVTLGRTSIDLPPLAFTALAMILLAAAVRRGRFLPVGRGQQVAVALVAGVVYGVAVVGFAIALGGGAMAAGQGWRPVLIALVVTVAATWARSGSRWPGRRPAWLPVSARLAAAGALGVLGGGALALAAGLLTSFGTATRVAQAAASGLGEGLGLLLLGLAYLPNAVLAGAGYASGAGFQLGAGTYSPFATHPVDLPAFPLLAAAPERTGWSHTGILLLLVPVLAAALMAWVAVRRIAARTDRIAAVLVASVMAALALAVLAGLADGGIAGGPWSFAGVSPLPFGVLTAGELALISVTVAALAPVRADAVVTASEHTEHTEQTEDTENTEQTEDTENTRDTGEVGDTGDAGEAAGAEELDATRDTGSAEDTGSADDTDTAALAGADPNVAVGADSRPGFGASASVVADLADMADIAVAPDGSAALTLPDAIDQTDEPGEPGGIIAGAEPSPPGSFDAIEVGDAGAAKESSDSAGPAVRRRRSRVRPADGRARRRR